MVSPQGMLWNFFDAIVNLNLCLAYQGEYWWSKKVEQNILQAFYDGSLWEQGPQMSNGFHTVKSADELIGSYEGVLLCLFLIPSSIYEDYTLIDAMKDAVKGCVYEF